MKLNICLDIDGTLTDPYCWIGYANSYFGKHITKDDFTVYDFHKVIGVSLEEFLAFYNIFGPQMHLYAPMQKGVKEVLKKLEKYHHLFYVTARESRMEQVTREWIKNNGLPQAELFCLGSHYKVDKAKELNCNIFVEDRYENALQLAKAGIKVLLVDCNYNRFPTPNNVVRVKNWDEIDNYLQKYGIALTA